MSQMNKTLCFIGAAVVATVLAVASRPGAVMVDSSAAENRDLCPQFKDPLAAKSLKIVRFDEGLASLSEIEVKETNGIWTLPSHDDYPADAQRNDEQGTVGVSLSIGTDGRVSGCSVTSSSGSRSLDNATCRILRSRARFTPAKLSNGQATTDTYNQRITWRLEG